MQTHEANQNHVALHRIQERSTFTTDDANLDALLLELQSVNAKLQQRIEAINSVTRRVIQYDDLLWLSRRMGEKIRLSFEFTPEVLDTPTPGSDQAAKINLIDFADNIGQFVINFSEDNKRTIAKYDVKRLFRMAAFMFHSDTAAKDDPTNAEKFRLAKALRDADDAEGLALLMLQAGRKLDVDYTEIVRQRIAAARKHFDAIEQSVGFFILQKLAVGWPLYAAGLQGYCKALDVLGDRSYKQHYEDLFGPMSFDENNANRHFRPSKDSDSQNCKQSVRDTDTPEQDPT